MKKAASESASLPALEMSLANDPKSDFSTLYDPFFDMQLIVYCNRF